MAAVIRLLRHAGMLSQTVTELLETDVSIERPGMGDDNRSHDPAAERHRNARAHPCGLLCRLQDPEHLGGPKRQDVAFGLGRSCGLSQQLFPLPFTARLAQHAQRVGPGLGKVCRKAHALVTRKTAQPRRQGADQIIGVAKTGAVHLPRNLGGEGRSNALEQGNSANSWSGEGGLVRHG